MKLVVKYNLLKYADNFYLSEINFEIIFSCLSNLAIINKKEFGIGENLKNYKKNQVLRISCPFSRRLQPTLVDFVGNPGVG